jgi:hypothetical protein
VFMYVLEREVERTVIQYFALDFGGFVQMQV